MKKAPLGGAGLFMVLLGPSSRSAGVDLNRILQRDGDIAAVRDATFVIGRGGSRAGTRGRAHRTADDGRLGAVTEYLSDHRSNSRAGSDFLDVLAGRLILDAINLRGADRRSHRIRVSAEADGLHAEAHFDLVVDVLAALELRDLERSLGACRDRRAVGTGDRVCNGCRYSLTHVIRIGADARVGRERDRRTGGDRTERSFSCTRRARYRVAARGRGPRWRGRPGGR